MAILSIYPNDPGHAGDRPAIQRILTNDTIATVTTAGYLNAAVQSHLINLSQSDMILVATSSVAGHAPNQSGWYDVSYSNGNWTLTPPSEPGAVTLPTIANHIATFTNTTGTISEDPATAISGGNIQAGLSGTAGSLSSFPGTASKGHLSLTAVANTGNTATVISNAAMGQATTVSVPDPGVATTNFILADNTGTQNISTGSLDVLTGNLIAGSSGHAGTLASFPGTASKGSLIVAGVANTGNTNTTISNAAMGQASIISIPDPANSAGQFLVGATATPFVSGNFPQASGTAGLMVDSGVSVASLSTAVTQLGVLHQVSVTFNTAQMVTAYDTPLTIVANPAASQMILVLQAAVYTASTGHTAYATGTAPIIQYSSGGTNGQHGAGTIATAAGLVAGDITAASSQVRNLFGIATGAQTGLSGLGLYFSNATGDYTAGTGTSITISVVYQLLTATV
jgi:hypothetical protein